MTRSHTAPLVLLSLALVLLGACATTKPPLSTAGVDTKITPTEAATRNATGTRILWGGVIVASTNLKDATQVEVLSMPLGKDQQPEVDAKPLGRFVILQPGYLESADYSSGRRITVVGTITGTHEGKIGESAYTYPVVAPDNMHLWPREAYRQATEPRFHFGVGVIFH